MMNNEWNFLVKSPLHCDGISFVVIEKSLERVMPFNLSSSSIYVWCRKFPFKFMWYVKIHTNCSLFRKLEPAKLNPSWRLPVNLLLFIIYCCPMKIDLLTSHFSRSTISGKSATSLSTNSVILTDIYWSGNLLCSAKTLKKHCCDEPEYIVVIKMVMIHCEDIIFEADIGCDLCYSHRV